jgi:VWFA-related protein
LLAGFIAAQAQNRPNPSKAAPAQAAPAPAAPAASPQGGAHREGTDNVLVDENGIPLEDQSGKTLPATAENQPADTGNGEPSAASNVPGGNTVNVPSNPGQPATDKNGKFVFYSETKLVGLHATVVDNHMRLVTSLNKANFTVYEDGQPQPILQFSNEDIPVSIGILIDNSGSMRLKRAAVNQAAINLVKSSNPKDEVFVVNFNDESFLDQDFTAQIPKLQEALAQIDSRGGTAMYDAVIAASDHLSKGARREKKVLLVVTDGEDNASRDTLEQAIRRVQDDNGPTIYTIGILEDEDAHKKRAKRALEALALQTGGVAFFPKNLEEVDAISQDIAKDIRTQYYIQYRPSRPTTDGGYRQVRVEAHQGKDKLQVRTRSGYFANGQQSAQQRQPSPAQPASPQR